MKPPQANNLGQILPLTSVFTLVFKMKEISEWILFPYFWWSCSQTFFIVLFVCLFMAVLGLRWCSLFSSHAMQALGARAAVVVVCGLNNCGSQALEPGLVAVAHRLSRSEACGIFPDQGSNPWQEDSLPLSHQGSPISSYHKRTIIQ